MVKHLRILGSEFKVNMDAEIGDRGEADITGHKIRIQRGLSPELKMATMIHEIIEVLNYDFEWKFDHRVISQLELGFKIVLSDNPQLEEVLFPKEDK